MGRFKTANFAQSVHRFAQGYDENLIDGANENAYLPPRLNREA
jgi:hypothetical protein